LDEFYLQITERDDGMKVLKSTFGTHPQIWKDDNNREMMLNVLVRIGTNMLLLEQHATNIGFGTTWRQPSRVAETILTFHEYGETMNIDLVFLNRYGLAKARDLAHGISSVKRDALKFYRKRVACKCLKRIHLEARETIPKMGKCLQCGVEKERESLSVCSRCMISHFCSRECQVANWSVHELYCDAYVNAKVNKHQEKEVVVSASSS